MMSLVLLPRQIILETMFIQFEVKVSFSRAFIFRILLWCDEVTSLDFQYSTSWIFYGSLYPVAAIVISSQLVLIVCHKHLFQLLNLPADKRTGPLQDRYNRIRKVRILLESSQMKLDDAILLFHDFWTDLTTVKPFV